MSVPIENIRLDGGTQSRASINEVTVAEYVDAMVDPSTVFPPVVVYFDGKDYWLADGFHRLAAWREMGRVEIPADVRQGDRRHAILHSVAANSAHGLRRTNDDKRRAVMVLLEDAEWSQWSDREIARRCAVSPSFVGGLRNSSLSTVDSEPRTYTTKHGTQAAMSTANIGGGSKAHQATSSQQTLEEVAPGPVEQAEQSNDDQETPAEEPDREVAKQRRDLAKLTTEALIDEVIGLGADLKDAKAEVHRQSSEIEELKEKLREATASDLGAAVGRLQRRLDQANFTRNEAMKTAKREEYKRRQAEKRVVELENSGVVVLN